MSYINFSGFTDEELLEEDCRLYDRMMEDYALPNTMLASKEAFEVSQAQAIFSDLQQKYGPRRHALNAEIARRGLQSKRDFRNLRIPE